MGLPFWLALFFIITNDLGHVSMSLINNYIKNIVIIIY